MLLAAAIVSVAYWIAFAVAVRKTIAGVPFVGRVQERASWPRVSIVIPARDEAAHIEHALRSKLDQDYPNLEVVFVDDRSTDDTGRIADALAASEPRLRVVHVEALTPGWLGKVHAMQRGLEAASGEWVLFSDADVALARDTLRRVIAYAEHEAADHVTLLPRVTATGALLEPALAAFFRVITAGARFWGVARPESSAAAGIGAFNMVRKESFARTPGLEWVKMDIGDDMALGLMVKRAGQRSRVLNGRDFVTLEFYASFKAMARSLEKNGASIPFATMVIANLVFALGEGGFLVGPPALAAAGYILSTLVSWRLARWQGGRSWPAFVPAVGIVLLTLTMTRSALLARVRGGVLWRGTFYSIGDVRAGNRLGALPNAKK